MADPAARTPAPSSQAYGEAELSSAIDDVFLGAVTMPVSGPLVAGQSMDEPQQPRHNTRMQAQLSAAGTSRRQATNGTLSVLSSASRQRSLDSDLSGEPPDGLPPPGVSEVRREAVSKDEKIQEKNRRAQKRFRERQKARVKAMEEQLVELTSQLDLLRQQNTSLLARNSVLTKVLALRDEQLQAVSGNHQAVELALVEEGAWPPLALLGPEEGVTESAPSSSAGVVPTSNGWHSGNSGAAAGDKVKRQKSGDLQSSLCLPAVASKSERLVPANDAQAAMLGMWKEYVRELAALLVELGRTPAGAPGAAASASRLEAVAVQASEWAVRAAALGGPATPRGTLGGDLATAQSHGRDAEGEARWLHVMRALDLSPAQKEAVLQLRMGYLQRLADILATRKQLLARVQDVMPHALAGNRQQGMLSMRDQQGMAELTASLRQESLAGQQLIAAMFQRVFAPVQFARAAVQSYPLLPDCLAIANWVTAEAGIEHRLAGPPQELPMMRLDHLPLADNSMPPLPITDFLRGD